MKRKKNIQQRNEAVLVFSSMLDIHYVLNKVLALNLCIIKDNIVGFGTYDLTHLI